MSTPRTLGACIRHGYGNSIHEKQDDCVNWFPVAEGVAAPLEPTPLTTEQYFLSGGGGFEGTKEASTFTFVGMCEMAESYAEYRVALAESCKEKEMRKRYGKR